MKLELTANRTVYSIHPCYETHDSTYKFTSNPSFICVALYVFLGSLCLITVCGNFLVIASIVYFKQLYTPNNYLVLSLAMADLLVGVLVFPYSMTFTFTSCWYDEDLFCKVRGSFDVTLSTASILNLCCISVDRYHAVCKPLTYKSTMNDRIIVMMILGCWGTAALIGIGIIIAGFNQGKCEENCAMDALILTTLGCMFSFYIPVIVMLGIYLKIFLVAQSQLNSIHSTACRSKKPAGALSMMERKATKTLAVVMRVFLLCWTPYFLCIVFQPLIFDITPIAVIETLNWLTLSNSMLNPFIYAFFYSWFRAAVRIMISGKIFQGDFTNTKLF
ncbi:trace amine-associated receptor 1-like [Girardinichthys multiradiatus]|uniref:trace amine-associated receptor 1-like n=1 Tax=Girardinichthys multiradiatus TaxID=208333 RepID=UPI001FAD8006|nr:trace amine-associated receptor 1-like [Girardinichthys multiradiatus]